MRNTIDLDELLTGKPAWPDVVNFFRDGEFHEEHYLVEAIEKHLLTEEHRKLMFVNKLTIEKILNGRWEYTVAKARVVNRICAAWNSKLGFEYFKG